MFYRADPDTMVMKLRLSIPELRITGQYKISGRIFVLAVEGTGTFWNILSMKIFFPPGIIIAYTEDKNLIH
jgi:hypothetical protein